MSEKFLMRKCWTNRVISFFVSILFQVLKNKIIIDENGIVLSTIGIVIIILRGK